MIASSMENSVAQITAVVIHGHQLNDTLVTDNSAHSPKG